MELEPAVTTFVHVWGGFLPSAAVLELSRRDAPARVTWMGPARLRVLCSCLPERRDSLGLAHNPRAL